MAVVVEARFFVAELAGEAALGFFASAGVAWDAVDVELGLPRDGAGFGGEHGGGAEMIGHEGEAFAAALFGQRREGLWVEGPGDEWLELSVGGAGALVDEVVAVP